MEKLCFELKNIELSYLDKEILRIEDLAIHQFDRIGIVGKNGAGKSTLMKLLAEEIQPTLGKVKSYVEPGYFKQLEAPKKEEAGIDPALLSRLAVPQNSESLSGGEQTKLKLAQLMSHYYEALLLDEPTTHMDQQGISYLIEELRYYYGALVIISHDRAVLDELVTKIWEVHDGRVHVYSGNYSDYRNQKKLEWEQQNQAHEQFLKEKSRLEMAAKEKMKKAEKVAQAGKLSKRESKAMANRMTETKSKGTSQKAVHRAAKAIEHRMEKLEEVRAVQVEKPIVFPRQKAVELHNKFPIMADRFTLRAGDNILLEEVNFQLPLGKKIAISGANGSGKSTLLQRIARKDEQLTISPKAKIGYFQQMSYQFSSDETVFHYIKNHSEHEDSFLRSVLHSMQFVDTDLLKKVKKLSGGEAIRLQLCLLFLGSYNILLLDEPTNFLDIQAIEALEQFVRAYQGTVILVSHDEFFIRNTADIQYIIRNKNLELI